MRKLEPLSWIAGIVSALLAVGGTVWAIWTHFYPSERSPDTSAAKAQARQNLQQNANRQKRFMDAYEAASYAQGNVKKQLNEREHQLYDAAYQRFRDGLHLGQQEGKDEEALNAYREAREMFERLK